MDHNFTPEIQQALVNMFATDGWKIFTSDVRDNHEIANSLVDIKDVHQLGFQQGQCAVLASIVNYEDTIRAISENVEEDENAEIHVA